MTPREAMNRALKDAINKRLRPRGFTGTLPHLRRRTNIQICLLSLQFYSAGGSFVVEVAECGPDGFTTSWGEHKSSQKVRAQDINAPRPRLGGADFPHGDHWFVFGPRNYEPDGDKVHPQEHYGAVADDVLRLLEAQAEPFWQEQLRLRSST